MIRPGEQTEFFARVPEPGSLRVQVELRDGGDWNDLAAVMSALAFHGGGPAGTRRLQWDPAEHHLVVDLFPGDHSYGVNYKGVRYETRRVHIESGETTLDRIAIHESLAITLRLSLARDLQPRESVSISILEGDQVRSIELKRDPLLETGIPEPLKIYVTENTKKIRAQSRLGLTGEIAVTEADIVPGRVLSLRLEEP